MPLWPFGRKRTAKLNDGPKPVRQGEKAVQAYPGHPLRRTGTGSSQSNNVVRKRSRRKKKASPDRMAYGRRQALARLERGEDLSNHEHSNESLTALPTTMAFATSPHLHPVMDRGDSIPYDFRLHAESNVSIPSARERGKLQRPQSLQSKRRGADSTIPRRKSSKRRKKDHVREEEIRAMSAPIPMKRPATYTGGMFRRDSKKIRGGMSRHFDRPTSNTSLPIDASIHSSMSVASETRAFRVRALDIFTPRPTIRYSTSSTFQNYNGPSRCESRRDKRPQTSKEDLKGGTIDDLADDLDAGALRMILERDQRRRDRKRQAEEERVRQKLERRLEKQRAKERRDQEAAAREDIGKGKEPALSGLGIATESVSHDHGAEPQEQGNTGTYLRYAANEPIPQPQTPRRGVSADGSSYQGFPTPLSPALENPLEEPILETAQAVRLSQASIPPSLATNQHRRELSNVSQVPALASESNPPQPTPPIDIPQPVHPRRPSSETSSSRRIGAFASFFRRGGFGKRDSMDRGRSTPSEISFSNTSRESMSRQPPPAHLQATQARRSSGAPVRTQSKFREDLPELPISPPESRMQSPEVTSSLALAAGGNRPRNLHTDADTPVLGSAFRESLSGARTDSPVSQGPRTSELMSQSLASVDSEGSWLSGKPMKRRSNQAHLRSSGGSISQFRTNEDFNTSSEELGIPDDEYFRRLTPQPDLRRQSAQSGTLFGRKPSSTAIGYPEEPEMEMGDEEGDSPGEPLPQSDEVVHGGVGRKPTVVHRETRVKSREGLLNYYQAGELQTASRTSLPDRRGEGSEQDSPVSPVGPVQIERARSVDLGKKGHVRALSAGSAKLLDIPAKRQSVDSSKRASSSFQL